MHFPCALQKVVFVLFSSNASEKTEPLLCIALHTHTPSTFFLTLILWKPLVDLYILCSTTHANNRKSGL